MQLIKNHWTISDKKEFLDYLKTFQREKQKQIWEQKIINTQFECLGILSNNIKTISKEISKGNFLSFLDLQIYDNFPAITIMGNLICKITDFELMKIYLDKYSEKIDNWSNCDQLKFHITKDNKKLFLSIAHEYLISPLPFRRRIAIIIMFNFINHEDIDKVFEIANSLKNEKHYYVNMANAWILCECFIKERLLTLDFIKNNNLNTFTLNKMISKCCDSYRINTQDKVLLKQLKLSVKQR